VCKDFFSKKSKRLFFQKIENQFFTSFFIKKCTSFVFQKKCKNMRSSTLMQTLTALDTRERRLLSKWLEGPVAGVRDDVRRLFLWLDRHLTKPDDALLKTGAWAAACGDASRPLDERQLNHLCSWLLGHVREFLAWREWQRDEAMRDLHLCRALRRYGLDAQFERACSQALDGLAATPYRDEHYHQMNFWLYRERLEHRAARSRAAVLPFEAVTRHAEAAFRLHELQLECSAAVLHSVAPQSAHRSAAAPAEPSASVRMYEALARCLREAPDDAAFFEGKNLLLAHWGQLRERERRTPYLLALNYAIRRRNQGEPDFLRHILDLYRSGLANGALLENGFLSRFTLLNAVTTALLLGESAGMEAWIEEYRALLPPRERYPTGQYALALYHLHLRDYDRVLVLLREVHFGDDVLTDVSARCILLRIYYERQHTEALEALLGSFDKLLRYHRATLGYRYDNYANLLRFVRLLGKKNTPAQRTALREEVQTCTALAERGWLLEQLGAAARR
jgi:hypothetical protein